MKNHQNIRKNLVDLVKHFPHLKENYSALVGYYWTIYDNADTLQDFEKATPCESITRNFRELVRLGLIPMPDRVKEARKDAQISYATEFSALT